MAWRTTAGRERLVFSDRLAELIDEAADAGESSADRRLPALRRCLDRLDDDDRSLVRRRYGDGDETAAIGRDLGKSASAVAMKLMRIRKRLGDCVRHAVAAEGTR